MQSIQYIFSERKEQVTTIEFKNSLPLKNVQRINSFLEYGLVGVVQKKEFRYSFDNSIWSVWDTLSLPKLQSIPFNDRPNFYLQIKYTRAKLPDANIQLFYLFYESPISTPIVPGEASINADYFQGQLPGYYLNNQNHFGPVASLVVQNIPLNDTSTIIGVFHNRIDSSLNSTLLFRSISSDTDGLTLRNENGTIILHSGVINVGDGATRVFAGYDSSGNSKIRTIEGAQAIQIYENGDTIVIGIDASFSGDNFGVNVGSGDVSVFEGKEGANLLFKTMKAGVGISLGYDDSSTILISGLGGADGGVWITDISPFSTGNVGDKVKSSDGMVLDSCLTDTSMLRVYVLALPGHTNYKPIVTINSTPVTLTGSADRPVFTGSLVVNYDFSDASIKVVHEDGASWTTVVDADGPAEILSANFVGTYPGIQTELKAGDPMQINVVTDVPITQIVWDNAGALTAGSYTASGTNNTFTVTIANNGNVATMRGFTLRVVKSTGSTSPSYVSTSHGNVELTDVVNCNNLYPTATFGTITYPATQSAIKLTESATVVNTLANYSSVVYSSPNSQLTITSPTTAQTPKTVTYLAGGYNISTNNLRMVATRNANNSTTTANATVWIANTPATLSVSNPAARLRSGGNDGTSAQSHTITITASQRLLAAPTLAKDVGGTWLDAAFTWTSTATSFTRSLQVHDNDAKGPYNWGAILGTNLAGIPTTTNTGSTQYVLGGFVQRTLTLAAFGWQTNMNVEVSDYSKLSSSGSGQVLSWVVLQNTRAALGNVTRPQASTWSASATFTNPTTINILDESATGSQSRSTTFTIQEGI